LPPYQRLLQGDDARQAQRLQDQEDKDWAAGHFGKALKAGEALLTLRRKLQGAEHWQAVDARWHVEALRRILKQAAAARRQMAEMPSWLRQAEQADARGRPRQAQPLWEKILACDRLLLGEDHPDTAASYNCLAANLYAQGRYAAAGVLYQRALAIYQKALGEGHPETANCRNNLAADLYAQGQYVAAGRLYEQALAVRRKVLGEDDPETANSYSNLAVNLKAQGQYAAAEVLYRKALAIRRHVRGEDDPKTAISYLNLASSLDAQGQYKVAQPLHQKALAIFRKALGEDHPYTAASYGSLAANLDNQGQYAAAQPLHQKALAARRKVLGADHPDTARSYSNMAVNLKAQGRYAAAQPLIQKALAIRRQVLGEGHPDTANSYSSLASNLFAQGQYRAAQPLFEKALAIHRQRLGDDHADTARSYSNLAADLKAQGRYAEAQPLYQKALDIKRKALGEHHPDTAIGYNNLAANLKARGQHAAAQPLFEKALAIWREALGERHPNMAIGYSNLAVNLDGQGRFAAAEPLHRKALAARRQWLGEEHADTADSYNNLAATLHDQGRYDEAVSLWEHGANAFAKARLRLAALGLERATITGEASRLSSLAAVLARNGRPAAAWQRFEENLARGTWDDLSARLGRSPAERDRQTALARELQRLDQLIERTLGAQETSELNQRRQVLLGQRRRKQEELDAYTQDLEKKYGPVAGQVFDRAAIQQSLRPDAALVGWIDIQGKPRAADPNGEHWAVILRARGKPICVRLRGRGPDGAWTDADTRLPTDLRSALLDRTGDWHKLADRLYEQRLQTLAGPLGVRDGLPAARQLVVLPSAGLAGLPLEVCARDYTVSYAPSGTLFAHLQRQPRAAGGGMLAIADPRFESNQPQAGSEDAWTELPGTRIEADRLEQLCRQAGFPFRLLADSDASEQALDRLARSKELAGYRYIHLATHGELNDRLPLQSAVILSRDRLPNPVKQLEAGQPVYDGRLTAEDVLERWDLHAELVTLSACETALGKYEGGEGFVGFTQALLLSGARSVCLSLWKVDDTATALLMQRFYANLLGQRPGLTKPLAKPEALAEAKKWLRNLSAEGAAKQAAALAQGVARGKGRRPLPSLPVARGAAAGKAGRPYAHPYYWAAFVLVGDGR
jgi:CHAT domain-containing protein/tetratricopeptide (TPR) repeat protein